MRFWPIRKKTVTTKRSVSLSDFFNYMQTKGWYKVSASVAMQLYEKNSALGDAIDTIKDGAKTITPLIQKGKDFIDKHEVLDLLNTPNPLMSYSDFIESAIINKLLTGNLFVSAFGNTKYVPNEIYITPTETIVAMGEGFNYSVSVYAPPAINYLEKVYLYDKTLNRLLANNMAEMFHIKSFINYSTTNGYVSNSILNSIIYEIEVLNAGNNHNMSMLLNGVTLSGVFTIDTEDQKVVDQFIMDARNYFSGTANAGKYLASKGKGIEFKPIQMTNKEMEALGNSEAVRKVIYDRYQIPSPLRSLGTETYSNYDTAQYVLYDKAVIPAISDIFSGLTFYFRRRKILEKNESISYDPTSIPALQTRFLNEIKIKKEMNIFTVNQIRAMLKEDSLGPEHDILYQSYTMVPVGTPQPEQSADMGPVKRFARALKEAGYSEEEITERVNKYNDDLTRQQ